MFLRSSPVLICISFLFLIGCSSSRSTLATVGDEQVPLREYEEMYARNNGGWEKAKAAAEDDRRRFLDLFIKYKLKLLEAKKKGLLQDTAVQSELRSYRASIGSSYMIGKELIEPRIREMHRRQKEEIRASHILVRLNPDASVVDTLVAYTKAQQLQKMLATSPFDSVARHHSQDPSAQTNYGDLGWFSQGRMVTEFEDAAYALQPGEVSPNPVRTRFGYHIIKVIARQPNKGSVRVSHILKRFRSQDDTASVRDSIDFILRRIESQEITFGQAAYLYSDDASGKERGGDLGFYDRSGLPADIAALFFSTPVGRTVTYRAPYGYHLFQVTENKPIPSFEEAEKDLRQRYQQVYYANDYEAYIHSLTKKYNLDFDVTLRYNLSKSFDSTKTAQEPEWVESIPRDWLSRTLFSYASKTFTVRDFVDRVNASEEFKAMPLTTANVDEIVERMSETAILDEHTSTVSSRYPQFEELMKEYENGTLIYRIEQDEVYSKVVVSDSLLRQHYESNRKRFRWPVRMSFAEIFVRSESLAVSLYERIKKGEIFDSLAARYTERPGFKEKKGHWGFVMARSNDLAAISVSMKVDSVTAPIPFESGWSIIKKIDRKLAEDKTFEEALPEVTSQYRELATRQREEEWIYSLKRKYGVEINEDVFREAFQGKPSE